MQARDFFTVAVSSFYKFIIRGDAKRVREKLDKELVDFGLLVDQVDISKYDYVRLPLKDICGHL